MEFIFASICFFAIAAIIWNLAAAAFFGDKEKRKALAGFFLVIAAIAVYAGMEYADYNSRRAGFIDNKDRIAAEKEGFSRADEWRAFNEEKLAKQKADEEQKVAACRSDLECWSKKAVQVGISLCLKRVQTMAEYEYEWLGGVFDRLSRVRWQDKENGIITLIGDKIAMRDEFGSWARKMYECDVDPVAEPYDKRLLEVRIY
ncbi:hypothetical protein GGR16_002433 [Chelatococcus caeni]|uniref:Uncharacterized protein n=1 Tax=Chelatococcus caeni TaxID=1348468 RepID=A0A840BWL4_9HYPH|nr:hypothetical protein [Chelatococcus caeni]MBB4017404.1 hypothetical protein [Chelatococcus caeni]